MIFRFDGFELDTDAFRLSRDGRPVPIQPKSLELLTLLLEERHRLVPKEELFERLWPDRSVGDAALATCLRSTRQALDDDARRQRFIVTQHGKGLRFGEGVKVEVEPGRGGGGTITASPSGTTPLSSPPFQHAALPARRSTLRLVLLAGATLLAVAWLIALVWSRRTPPTNAPFVSLDSDPRITDAPPRLALLPLSASRSDAELELLAAALSETSARALTRLGWVVFGPDSLRELALEAESLTDVAEALDTSLLLTGSVARDAPHLPAQLVLSLHHLWPPRDAADHAPLRMSIPTLEGASGLDGLAVATREVVAWIQEASGNRLHHSEVQVPTNLSAYRLYLRGRQWLDEPGCEAGARAELIEQSLGLGPTFGPTWMLAALLHRRLGGACLFGRPHLEEALAAAQRAAALDPLEIEPQVMVATLHLELGRHEAANDQVRRLLRHFPDQPAPACLAARIHTATGTPSEAISALAVCERSRGLSGSAGGELPTTRLLLGEPERFLETAQLDASLRSLYFRGLALHLVDRDAEARSTLEPLFATSPSEVWGRMAHALLAIIEERPQETTTIVTAIANLRTAAGLHDGELDYSLGQLAALAGDNTNALAYLRLAAERGFHCAPCLISDTSLAALRQEPAFAILVADATARTAAVRR